MFAVHPPRGITSDDVQLVAFARARLLPEQNAHLLAEPRDVHLKFLFVDNRINIFSDVVILLCMGDGEPVGPYRRFLKDLARSPLAHRQEKTIAADHLAVPISRLRNLLEEIKSSLGLAKFMPLPESYKRAHSLYWSAPEKRRGYLQPLALFDELDRASVERYVRRFIDADDMPQALDGARVLHNITDLSEALQHAYEHYLNIPGVVAPGQYPVKEWSNFIAANKRLSALAAAGHPLSAQLILDLNAIVLEGPKTRRLYIRLDPISIGQDAILLHELFDDEGKFKSSVPVTVPFEGFYMKRHMYRRLYVNGAIVPFDTAYRDYCRGENGVTFSCLEPLVKRNFRDLDLVPGQSEVVRIIMSPNTDLLIDHLHACTRYFNTEAYRLARWATNQPMAAVLPQFVEQITHLAAAVARVTEAPHVPIQGNGRTGLLTERYACELFGIELPDELDGRAKVIQAAPDGSMHARLQASCNGTWMREEERAELLFKGAMSMYPSAVRCEKACRRFLRNGVATS